MDSFYEEPRTAPIPMSRNEIPAVPLVPEVSMLFQNNAVVEPTLDSMYLSYNAWKNKNQAQSAGHNFAVSTNKSPSPSESFMAKQVRFESPFVQKQQVKEQNPLTTRREPSKPFKDVYMANLPDRHLDLSVIEPPKMLHSDFKENACPNINLSKNVRVNHNKMELVNNKQQQCLKSAPYAFEREQYKDDPLEKNRVIDMYNYNRENFEINRPYVIRQSENIDKPSYNSPTYRHCKEVSKCNASIQTEVNEEHKIAVVESSNEPTVKDLLKIIHQQNNQLLILQKQVATLLTTNDSVKQIESNPNRHFNCCSSTQLDAQQNMCKGIPFQRNGPLQQFSLDVMTSFEVAIRRQQNVNRLTKDIANQPPKICEVTETDSNIGNILDDIPKVNRKCDDSFKTTDVSLTFNEPVHVPQTCPSPDNTIQIDMKDYSSDSDDGSNSQWSLYNNVRGQVNHILKKSGIQPRNNSPLTISQSTNRKSSNLKKKVKEATIKHLKSIGVHVPNIEDTDDDTLDTRNKPCENQNDVSFMVKQLLMKYLPDEQLGKVATQSPRRNQHNDIIKRRPEFSFASVQYMQKYNLLTDLNGHQAIKQNQIPLSSHQEPTFERILDITAIRQQPKLL